MLLTRLSPLLLLLLLLSLVPPAAAQEGARGPMDFKDADLELVIETVAKLTGKSFIYDDRIRGTVTVIAGEDVTVEEAYKIFESILQVKGFTTVPSPGGMLKIVPVREAKESPIETFEGRRATPNRDLFVTRLIPLEFVKADNISNTLKPLVSKDASVIAYAPTNTMIITDTAANIRRLMTIIAEIDVSTYSEMIKVFPLEYADANQLSGQLGEIFGSQDSAAQTTPRARRARTRRAAAAPDASAGGDVIGSVGEPRFIVDERTNSIIVIATRAAIDQIASLIELLDYQRKGSGRIHVYRLQNADAEEMSDTLSGLTGGGSGGRRSIGTPRAGGAAGAVAAAAAGAADLGDGVRVTADPPTNSLIIQATPEAYNTLSEVIEALDIRRPQVLVEALILEVAVDDSSDLGIGWLYQSTIGSDEESRISIGNATPTSIPPGELAGEFLGPLTSTVSGGLTSAILGRTITIVDPDTGEATTLPVIQGIIDATDSDADTNIVSAPNILTADNEEAEIVVGENIPVPTSRLQAASSAGGADPGFQTSQNITRQDVGVTLRVTPQISEGDTVRLQIFQELSERGTVDPNFGPNLTNRQIENTVYVRDGEAVMIGGILQETQSESIAKVPWLGDIPFLGWLFKSRTETVDKTNLLVILTPHIVRDPHDLQRHTVEHRERFRDAAREGLEFTDEELEARRVALEAGIDLPKDSNPVRRELSRHSRVYPTETLPEMRSEASSREQERVDHLEALKAAERSGNYLVQVSFFGDADEAVTELERMISEGYDGTLLSHTERGRVVHYVQLGPYLREPEAQHVARELRANLDLNAIVVVRP